MGYLETCSNYSWQQIWNPKLWTSLSQCHLHTCIKQTANGPDLHHEDCMSRQNQEKEKNCYSWIDKSPLEKFFDGKYNNENMLEVLQHRFRVFSNKMHKGEVWWDSLKVKLLMRRKRCSRVKCGTADCRWRKFAMIKAKGILSEVCYCSL